MQLKEQHWDLDLVLDLVRWMENHLDLLKEPRKVNQKDLGWLSSASFLLFFVLSLTLSSPPSIPSFLSSSPPSIPSFLPSSLLSVPSSPPSSLLCPASFLP